MFRFVRNRRSRRVRELKSNALSEMIATPVVGPHEHNGPITVVAMQKEVQTRRVHERKFGERERLAHEPSQPLPQRVIPTLHMSGFPSFLSHSCVLLFWNDGLIGPPKIGVAVSCLIGCWNGFPQTATRLFAAVSHRVSHDLSRLAAECYPDPG